MPEIRPALITLLTDYGTRDHYVGAMKGAILEVAPEARLVDISHEVPPQDVAAAGYLLQAAAASFPSRTIHLCVVDPGVGTTRRVLLVTTERHLFLAPDNGLLGWVFDRQEPYRVFDVTADHYFRKPVSRTFHGRDVFAPVAGWLARGIEPEKFGAPVEDPVRLHPPKVARAGEREFVGTVVFVDRFGNLITNFPSEDMEKVVSKGTPPFRFRVGSQEVAEYRTSYAEGGPGRVFAISGSSGFVEFSVQNGSAAELAGAARGDNVRLLFG